MTGTVRSLGELVDVPQPAWPALRELVDERHGETTALPVDADRADRVLHALQVTVGSALGALAHRCGGLLVDHGWLRILGGGSDQLPDLAEVNGLDEAGGTPPSVLTVAFDVLGGEFAIDGGGLNVAPGEVCYRGPDLLRWVALGVGHGSFVQAALSRGLDGFYEPLRWPGWQREVGAVSPRDGLSLYPPPFAEEGRDLAQVSRRPVPFDELRAFYTDAGEQLRGAADGDPFALRVDDER